MKNNTYDIAIIGGGPAGISAAIQARRLNLRTILFERDELGGTANIANLVENFPGLEPISGRALMRGWIEHLRMARPQIVFAEINAIEIGSDSVKRVITSDNSCAARSVIIATGGVPKRLPPEFGENIRYYADPLKVEHAGKDVVIIGSSDSAFDQGISFARLARSVKIFTKEEIRALPILVSRAQDLGIEIVKSDFTPSSLALDVVIIACIGKDPKNKFFGTDLPHGVFLAGDCTRAAPERQIAIASADGMRAAIMIKRI